MVAKGFEPTFFTKVDPKTGPLDARLQPRAAVTMPPTQILLGRVLDPNKKPLANAVVSVSSTTIGNTTYGSPPNGTDPLAVTDEQGEFEIRCPKKFDAMELRVEALRFARRNIPEVRPGTRRQDFIVTPGVALAGRVLHQGKPMKNVTIGVVSVDRSMGNFTGDFVTGTGEDGRFVFPNLPPDREYAVYGLMESLKSIGVLPTKSVRVNGDGSKKDLGDWHVVAGFRLEGQVLLSDSNAIPAHTHFGIGREAAWDSSRIELPPDGRFSFTNVPGEVLSVNTRVNGYRFASRNASLDRLNPFQLMGRLQADKTNLTILLEPAEMLRPDYSSGYERPGNLPLCGIEAKHVIPDAIPLSGRVVDAADDAPIPEFRVTPGIRRDPRSGWTEWQKARTTQGTNGSFCVEVVAKRGAIVLLAEADGYLPVISDPLPSGGSNCIMHLKRGSGPAGVVQLPHGSPLPSTQVFYLSGDEQAGLGEDGRLRAFIRDAAQVTDENGKFSFAPKPGPGELIVACSSGFGRLSLASPGGTNVIIIQPWAKVQGRLVRGRKPVANEHVDIAFDSQWQPGRPHLSFPGAITDDEGRFTIEHVPAGALQLMTRKPLRQRAWTSQTQRRFEAKPAQTVDLGNVELSEGK